MQPKGLVDSAKRSKRAGVKLHGVMNGNQHGVSGIGTAAYLGVGHTLRDAFRTRLDLPDGRIAAIAANRPGNGGEFRVFCL